ncbi:hypothetical protein HPULCUR_005147 [Helicostylum pulchrum]|uniref:Uncharacterized protein n=1 Tax=Helicostylum pulchrum TaxID=562976 RepID=A0ABP9XZJ5_9FUNG
MEADILAWKRPGIQSKNENVNKQNGVIEVESTRSVNSVTLNRQESISKTNDLPDQDTLSESSNKPRSYKESKTVPEDTEDNKDDKIIINHSTKNINNSINGSTLQLFFPKRDKPDDIAEMPPPPTHLLDDSIVNDDVHNESYIENPGQSDPITDTADDIRMTPELDTDTNTQSQKIPTTPKSYEDQDEDRTNMPYITSPIRNINKNNDDDDDDDEIQLVVSKRGDTALSPVRKGLNQYTNGSPIRTASEHYIKGSPVRNTAQLKSPTSAASPARYQSPFMSRLFHLAQSSNSRDSKGSISSAHHITVRPKPSESASSITSARDNNIHMSLLENPLQKRPSKFVEEPSMSTIEVSGVMPQPHFKKPKTMSLRKVRFYFFIITRVTKNDI